MIEQVELKTESGNTYSYEIPNDKVIQIQVNGEVVSLHKKVDQFTDRWDEGMKAFVKRVSYALLATCFGIFSIAVFFLIKYL